MTKENHKKATIHYWSRSNIIIHAIIFLISRGYTY